MGFFVWAVTEAANAEPLSGRATLILAGLILAAYPAWLLLGAAVSLLLAPFERRAVQRAAAEEQRREADRSEAQRREAERNRARREVELRWAGAAIRYNREEAVRLRVLLDSGDDAAILAEAGRLVDRQTTAR